MAFLCQTSGKIDPHDYLRISVALISILPLVENWLTQEKVLNRLFVLLFVLSIIQENYKNYKANNRKLSNLTGLRKKKKPYARQHTDAISESNPECFHCRISFCLPIPLTSTIQYFLCSSQDNAPRKQSSPI